MFVRHRVHPMDTTARTSSRAEDVRVQYAAPDQARDYAASYTGTGPSARYFASRFHAVDEALLWVPGGELLDVGCGPGMLVRHLLDTRPGDFTITASDSSPAMLDTVRAQVGDRPDVRTTLSSIEDMPFPSASFDVVVATGVLDYVDVRRATAEITRVVRPGGVVVVSMLNPTSPYRLVEWGVWWPTARAIGRMEGVFGVPEARRHGAARSGIRAKTATGLRRAMREAGLVPEDLVFYDRSALVPPLDAMVHRWHPGWRQDWVEHPERTVARGPRGRLGTGYLVVARRALAMTAAAREPLPG